MDFKKILLRTNGIDVEKARPNAIVMCTKDAKIQWVNDIAVDIFETSKMHLLTSNLEDFIENPLVRINNAIINNKPEMVKITGKETYLDMTAREIQEGYVLDIRHTVSQEQNDIFEELEQAGLDKNAFLLKLANDLKSPIQSIVGFSQAMADGLGGEMNEQQEKYIKIINKNSAELMYFVDKLLELSKTESIVSAPEFKTFDISNLISSVVKYNEQLYKDKNVKITINQEENVTKTVSSDENSVKSIIHDVLEVILRAVDMGEIVITLSTPTQEFTSSRNLPQRAYTMITISSSALLLSENDLECMFDPYKIVNSANRKNVLRAIVLASVKNLVQSLNGTIWVESQILKNTSFNIIF